jgi:hypothetical protein
MVTPYFAASVHPLDRHAPIHPDKLRLDVRLEVTSEEKVDGLDVIVVVHSLPGSGVKRVVPELLSHVNVDSPSPIVGKISPAWEQPTASLTIGSPVGVPAFRKIPIPLDGKVYLPYVPNTLSAAVLNKGTDQARAEERGSLMGLSWLGAAVLFADDQGLRDWYQLVIDYDSELRTKVRSCEAVERPRVSWGPQARF